MVTLWTAVTIRLRTILKKLRYWSQNFMFLRHQCPKFDSRFIAINFRNLEHACLF